MRKAAVNTLEGIRAMCHASVPRPFALLVAAFLAFATMCGAPSEAFADMDVQDGMAQPLVAYSDVRASGYTNDNSQLWRFAVYVETDYDTDMDGACDLVKAYVQVPREAVEGDGGFKAPVILSADPYSAGANLRGSDFAFGEPAIDDEALMGRPAHHAVSESLSTKDLALSTTFGEPDDWTREYDYFLVRGFAVVQAAGLGTYGSEGIECVGTVMERDAFVAIVEWLAGNPERHAFADATATSRVDADWSNGSVGMIGLSYPAAMCYAVATSGVEGLKTVVPLAGLASWYDAHNQQGISTQSNRSYNYMTILGDTCASRLFPQHSPDADLLARYQRYRRFQNDAQTALEGDYGPFWAARDWFTAGKGANMTASALVIHGLNDGNVAVKQSDLMRDAFLANGCEVKMLLHQNLHVTPNQDEDTTDEGGASRIVTQDIMIGDHSYLEWLNLWFTRALLGVDNDAATLPDFTVQSNVDGTFYGTDRWDEKDAVTLRPAGAGETTVRPKGDAPSDGDFAEDGEGEDLFNGTASDHAALWTLSASEQVTVAGKVGVHVRMKVDDTSEGDIMVAAVLQDVADEPFPAFAADGQVPREKVGQRQDSPHNVSIVRWLPEQTTRKVIAKGAIDLRNPEAGYDPTTATKRDEPIAPDTYYDYTIWLDPTYYTVPAGHRLELYLVPSYGYSGYADDEARAFILQKVGLDESSIMHVRQDFNVTMDDARSFATVPIAEEVGYGLASQSSDAWEKGGTQPLSLLWRRNIDDGETFFHFRGVVVDGQEIGPDCYVAKEGGVEVELATSYLHTLEAGEHTVVAQFDDGEGDAATFVVADAPAPQPAGAIGLKGSGHVEDVGDLEGAASDTGLLIGTTGESRRLEAFWLSLPEGTDGAIQYRGHVQELGWTDWVPGCQPCGTTGQSLRLEAVQLALDGAIAANRSVWYRVHSQDYGWLGWAHDGEPAGTAGQSLRAEAMEVAILPAGQAPADRDPAKAAFVGTAAGRAHVQESGWTTRKGTRFGTEGRSLRLEALALSAADMPWEGALATRVHAQDLGWLDPAGDGQVAGTTGESRRLEAVALELAGDAAGHASVWYRVHSQDHGWLGWAHDGQPAGTTGLALRAECVEVQFLPTGAVPADLTDEPAFVGAT